MWSLKDASPERFRPLAREISESGLWRTFLTPQEHALFVVALDHKNPLTWHRFLDGKIPLRLRILGSEDAGNSDTDVDAVALAFRVRYMLWESRIDHTDSALWEDSANDADRALKTPDSPVSALSKANRDDNEDYDDDYDDNDEEDAQETEPEEPPLVLISAEVRHEDSEPDPKGLGLALQKGARMYDTFEQDLESLNRFNRLKESDEEMQRELDDPSSTGAANGKLNGHSKPESELKRSESSANVGNALRGIAKTAQFGSANLCLKHLLTTIEQKRQSLNVTDMELRNLISDVRKNRSKWASEERIGQEELYEACERVVQDLRNTTEHSTPFLNKVSKREAPNYYDIIKEPMDLNTVMRKLRALQYGSKREFVNDLNLIWSNCLTYNSDPTHFLRKHAIAMRNKTQALAPLIPDVTIRSRTEVEAEAEILERRRREQKRKTESEAPDSKRRHVEGGKENGIMEDGMKNGDKVNGNIENGDAGREDPETEDKEDKENAGNEPSDAVKGDSEKNDTDQKDVEKSGSESSDAKIKKEEGENIDEVKADGAESDTQSGKAGEASNGTNAENGDVGAAHTDNVGSVMAEIDESMIPPGDSQASGLEDEEAALPNGSAKSPNDATDSLSRDDDESKASSEAPESGRYTPQEEDYWTPDAESAMWTRATRRKRIECILARQTLFTDNKLQMDAPISLRNQSLMLQFERTIKGDTDASGSGANSHTPPPFASGMSLLSSETEEEPFMLEYEVNAGVPADLRGDSSSWITAPVPRAQDLPPSRYLASGELNSLINRNLNEMQLIRRIIAKILYIRDLQSGQFTQELYGMAPYAASGVIAPAVAASQQIGSNVVSAGAGGAAAERSVTPGSITGQAVVPAPGTLALPNGATTAAGGIGAPLGGQMAGAMASQINSDAYRSISDPEEDISSRLPGALEIDARASASSMERAVAKIFMQAGFEAANPRALDCVTAIAGDYLLKLGTTLVANLEAPDSTASFDTVLTGTLQEMGVQKPGQLTKYISDDVLRQGRRLATFRSRLNNMLVEILRPEVERYQDEQFQEDSEQFVFGQFSNELGDDYFGFRDLGLDKELSIASIAVPFHLLQQRIAGQSMGSSGGTGSRKRGNSFPQYETLTPEKIAQMPVLLRGAFERLAAKPLGLPCSTALSDTELSEATHAGLADAHAEVIVQMYELSGKKQPESRQAKEIAKQLALKQAEGCSAAELEEEKRQIETEFLAKMAVQANVARQKLPANGKLVTRKKRFDTAYVLVKTEKIEKQVEEEPEKPVEDSNKASDDEISDNMIDFGTNGENDADSARGNDETNDLDIEPEDDSEVHQIGSLAFDDDPTIDSGFAFDDSLPTGSLMMQGNDNDDDEDEEVGDTNDDLGFEFMNK